MPADRSEERQPKYSRRRALGKLGLGLTAIAGAVLLLRNLVPSAEEPHRSARLPGPDSIFHPRSDRPTDRGNPGSGA
jgi:hypothetical protein